MKFLLIRTFQPIPFYIIPYCLFGSLFFSYFYNETFILYINGNGGFVGNYLNQTFLNNLIGLYEGIFYYFLISIIIVLFLISIKFKLKNFYLGLKKFISIFFRTNKKNYTNKNEIIDEYIPQEEIKNLIQEDLPFIRAEKNQTSNSSKFKLPSIDLLKFVVTM